MTVPSTTETTTPTTSQTTPPPTPTPIPDPTKLMKVRVMSAPFYQLPSDQSLIVGNLSWLTEVGYISGPDQAGFNLIKTSNGKIGYCLANYLADQSAYLYAQIPEMSLLSVIPGYTGAEKKSQLVDVRQADPSICIDLIFASKRNFTGTVLYERDLCLLQKGTMEKLKKAQALFRKNGYSIKIYDAYRPYSVTVKLATFNTNSRYLADPAKGSIHNRGAAVDMTIVNAKGVELAMPSLIHTLDARAGRTNPDLAPEVIQNLAYVEDIMKKCGFIPYKHEWWHYSDAESGKYPYMDLSMADFEMVASTKKPSVTPPPVRDPSKTGFINVPIALVPTPTPTPTPKPTPPT